MRRIVIHNTLTRRSIGRFRTTGGAHDHSDCGCGCGGKGDCNHNHDKAPSPYATAEMGIDVAFVKGGYGRPKLTESRHYNVPKVTVDPRGHAPSGAFVADQLRKLPEYQQMVRDGWAADKVEGYYKREQRDFGHMI